MLTRARATYDWPSVPALDGVDMRDETLQVRKLWLGKLLKRSGDGILYNDQ
jgi:hypothetical protein